MSEKTKATDEAQIHRGIAANDDAGQRLSTNTVPSSRPWVATTTRCRITSWDGVQKRIPHLTYKLFERSGHFPMLEQAAEFDDALIRWFGH
jgi:pimeloyl-ACP methyl ester carboxylesterase